jgi:hypothetical protein
MRYLRRIYSTKLNSFVENKIFEQNSEKWTFNKIEEIYNDISNIFNQLNDIYDNRI